MKAKQTRDDALVRRITIDEKLSEDLIRALVSPLADGTHEFSDGEVDWGKEDDLLVRSEDYIHEFGIPSEEKENFPWSNLREGQVFLSGQFQPVGHQEKPERFRVTPGPKRFMRIDGAVKEQVKRLYFQALKTERRK